MSRPEPAAAPAGARGPKKPAAHIQPNPVLTASPVPSRRCSAGPSGAGVLTGLMLGQAMSPSDVGEWPAGALAAATARPTRTAVWPADGSEPAGSLPVADHVAGEIRQIADQS